MFRRQKTGSVLCPSCGQLVGVNDDECLNCGRKRPGMWGFAGPLRALARGDAFLPFVMWLCAAGYLATLAADPSRIGAQAGMDFLSPSWQSLLRFGGAGGVPVFWLSRPWTLLSAGWLHGGLLHIGFNLMLLRYVGPGMAEVYGPARTILIYVASGIVGFTASSVAFFLPLPGPLAGAPLSVGASASVFGMYGAILHYGRRSGSTLAREQATLWIVGGLLLGFMLPRVDNWAHLGGLAGGYLTSKWLDPLKPERGDHTALAVVALALSAAAVLVSLIVPFPPYVSFED